MNDRDGSLAAGGGSLDRNGAGKQNRTAIWALQMLHRGIYADQLAPFLMRFPIGSQLLVLQSEDFFRNEAATAAAMAGAGAAGSATRRSAGPL